MDLRICATAEVREGSGMSKAPDLSAFPIPRKGGAKPITDDETENGKGEGGGPLLPAAPASEDAVPRPEPKPEPESDTPGASTAPRSGTTVPRSVQTPAAVLPPSPSPQSYGQTVATTVKLDENRYLRLVEAGRPGPGRLKRRTIQDMLIEALDEWFAHRQI